MIEVNSCPFCDSNKSEIIGQQDHEDKYLNLVD